MECIFCGSWFGSSNKEDKVCSSCERAMRQLRLDMSPVRLMELAQTEKAGRLVALPEGTVSMLMAKFVNEGDSDMFAPSVKTRGNEDHLLALLSLAVSAVAQAQQMDYKVLLAAMIANPPVGTLKPAEAEEALREEAK